MTFDRSAEGDLPPAVGAAAWVLVSDRGGDAKQTLALANAIGLPYEVRCAIPYGGAARGNAAPRRFSPKLLDPKRSSALELPWPSLVVAAGSWPIATALWMRRLGRVRPHVVIVGRPPCGKLDEFAAIVAPGQYRIPAHPTVVSMKLPPIRPDGEAIRRASERARSALEGLPRPLTAVFVGGPTKPFRFDVGAASGLAEQLRRIARREGGTAYVVTSKRTPPEASAALRAQLPPGGRIYDWALDCREDNPYLALLGLADRFIVSADSVSMLLEACSRGRPVAIAELPLEPRSRSIMQSLRRRLAARSLDAGTWAARWTLAVHRLGIANFSRDLGRIHQTLIELGLATWLSSESFVTPSGKLPDELCEVAARVRVLLAQAGAADLQQLV
jgi:mitochondrial fission protein ELM1